MAARQQPLWPLFGSSWPLWPLLGLIAPLFVCVSLFKCILGHHFSYDFCVQGPKGKMLFICFAYCNTYILLDYPINTVLKTKSGTTNLSGKTTKQVCL